MSLRCNVYYFMVERLASNFAVYPIGNLNDHHASCSWDNDESILTVVNQLDHGCLYLDCARTPLSSNFLGSLIRLYKKLTSRDSRLILCDLQPALEVFIRKNPGFLKCFDIHDGVLPGSGPRLLDPSCLAWNDGTIPKFAQAIYEDRAFDRLPILADALEEAGCINEDILNHCRQTGEHVQGCWLIDLLRKR